MMHRYIYELVIGNKTQSIKNVSHMSVVFLYCKTRKYLCSDEHSEGEHNKYLMSENQRSQIYSGKK